jgi:predicted nucleic acid-binding protein
VRVGRISEQTAAEAVDWLHALGIPTSSTKPLIGDALTIAMTFRRTVYDDIYRALAVTSGRHLLTADERLANAAGIRLPVRWLGAVVCEMVVF